MAQELNLPFIYVRSSAKSHGLENLIEGNYKAGQKVVVVEDSTPEPPTPVSYTHLDVYKRQHHQIHLPIKSKAHPGIIRAIFQ